MGRQLAEIWTVTSASHSIPSIATCETSNGKVRLCFRNYTDKNLLLCWMDSDGAPHHFYKLPPCPVDMIAPVSEDDHLEQSTCGHAFAIYEYDTSLEKNDNAQMPPSVLLDSNTRLLGGYRPLVSGHVEDDDEEGEDNSKRFPCHLIMIEPAKEAVTCRPCKSLRGSSSTSASTAKTTTLETHDSTMDVSIANKLVYLDPTPIDTTTHKSYRQYHIADWPVFMTSSDYNGLTKAQKRALETDLRVLQECLPPHAVKALKCNTPLYINKYLRYGPALCPQRASGMCFHPHVDWLVENGLHRQKVECVELYSLSEYMEERDGMWQPGGLLIHEFSHAYHFKMLSKGYANPIVKECYEQAMRDKLYDSVHYHKPDGTKHAKPTRAYACTDQMEYFAELSVACLGGKDESVEFNKWFPFNRAQLKKHDPRAFAMLKQVWKLPDLE